MKKIINPWRNHPEYNFLMNQEKAKEMGFPDESGESQGNGILTL